jgi:hypothetical protein
LNNAARLVKGVKYSVYEADRKVGTGERDRQGIKLIFEAVDLLNELKKMIEEGKKEKEDRQAYVRGKFRVEKDLPFTLENF